MTLVQLRHLVSLAQTGSFSRSAEALHLTQPALSRSIRSLEDELGQPLFDRIGWRSEPTPFGREVLARARRLITEAEDLQETAERLQAGQAGRLRVGLGSGPGAILTVPILRHMATHHPAAQVEFARGHTALLEQALRERRLDALVVDARSVPPSADLQVEPLAELRGAFLCRAGHPLLEDSAPQAPLTFETLRRYPLASTPLSDEIGRLLLERYGPQAHLDDCITLRCEDIATLVQVVASSDAILLAVRAAAPDLVELPLTPPLDAAARFGLVTLVGRSEPPLLGVVRGLIGALLRD
ncbi:LysR family transcriptional regulator [Sphaerotilus microaerophilus]|uniref:LysR family transcriptional regulator n=1 Tax=Sphaerotilus microaerophilus TaxID=2914710 RepID=A0ABM7YTT8_9BURK|nr:LysR family transcriptional regulator [Sphaerotilus sp. FB-5]BDI08104.1 LysR family transcriptional regulator [Sphaerotilus sp. FB-5]